MRFTAACLLSEKIIQASKERDREFGAVPSESSKLAVANVHEPLEADRSWTCVSRSLISSSNVVKALRVPSQTSKSSLTLRVNTDEHRTTGVSTGDQWRTACGNSLRVRFVRRQSGPTQGASFSMECHSLYQEERPPTMIALDHDSRSQKIQPGNLLSIRHFCI